MAEWSTERSHGGVVQLSDVSQVGNWQQVTSNASANTKGSWTVQSSSTPYAAQALLVSAAPATSNLNYLLDIGVGGAGSEQIIFADFLISGQSRTSHWLWVPVSVPASSRLAVRCAAGTGSNDLRVACHLIAAGPWSRPHIGKVVAFGANSGTSGGTQINPGGSANTYGSYVQLTGSTSHDVCAIAVSTGGGTNTSPANTSFQICVSVGASSSEVEIINGHRFPSSGTADYYGPHNTNWVPCQIPAGSRVAVKAKSGTTDATDRLFDIVVYGLVA